LVGVSEYTHDPEKTDTEGAPTDGISANRRDVEYC
jgi:hypothetical protein